MGSLVDEEQTRLGVVVDPGNIGVLMEQRTNYKERVDSNQGH